jgi:hypothetical protein
MAAKISSAHYIYYSSPVMSIRLSLNGCGTTADCHCICCTTIECQAPLSKKVSTLASSMLRIGIVAIPSHIRNIQRIDRVSKNQHNRVSAQFPQLSQAYLDLFMLNQPAGSAPFPSPDKVRKARVI